MGKKPKIQPWGEVTQELENVLLKMAYDHKAQYHEILGAVHAWLEVHAPQAKETYTADGSSPVYYYGHKDGLK